MTQATLTATQRDVRRYATRRLRDQLRAEAMRGSFSGGLLPSESQLMTTYGVPRAAVREALDLLRDEGIIERIQGTGTLAIAHRHSVRMVEAHGFDDRPAATGLSNRVIAMEIITMPRVVAGYLHAEPGEDCLLYEYIGYLYGQATGVYTNYVRFPEANSLMRVPFRSDWYTLLREGSLEICENELAIELMLVDEYVADLVEATPGTPVFGMRQLITGPDGRRFNFAILRMRGDRTSFLTRAISAQVRVRKVVGA